MSNTQQYTTEQLTPLYDGATQMRKLASPVISVQNLFRVYGKSAQQYEAVAGVSFEIYPGEIYGLLGTNGAGKTSTLEVLEGIAEASDGTVTVLGVNPFTQRAKIRPEMGIMLQSGGLPPQLTALETLTMWAGTCTSPRPVGEVLDDVNLTHRGNTKVSALSGGEQRRLDLACALVGNPSVIFLDEPTTGLDPESRRQTWELLARLKSDGVTMVLTTHYLEEAEYLCDRIGILHQGKLQLEGTLSELANSAQSSICFVLPQGVPARELPVLPAAGVEVDGPRVRILTRNLQEDATTVLNWAATSGLVLADFRAQHANLETVFMSIAKKQ